MLRALIEFLFVVVLAMVARAILNSVLRGVKQAGTNAFRQTMDEAERRSSGAAQQTPGKSAGVLHRDPVCGTFVAESTPYKREQGGKTEFFCSQVCREAYSPLDSSRNSRTANV